MAFLNSDTCARLTARTSGDKLKGWFHLMFTPVAGLKLAFQTRTIPKLIEDATTYQPRAAAMPVAEKISDAAALTEPAAGKVIIIGAGIAGLSCGCYLQMN